MITMPLIVASTSPIAVAKGAAPFPVLPRSETSLDSVVSLHAGPSNTWMVNDTLTTVPRGARPCNLDRMPRHNLLSKASARCFDAHILAPEF